MKPIDEKRNALDRALEMLSRDNVGDLRYAALELRRCIEAVVYEKLWAYRDRFPPEVARKWQPPQAFRALLVMEPDAEQTAITRVARQCEPGEPASGPALEFGTDQRFSSAWLNRTYNKLGSYVHASWPFAKNPDKNLLETAKGFLQQTALDMAPLVRRSFTCTLAEVVEFQCSECGTAIKANVAGLKQKGEVVCLNPDCECRYFATPAENGFAFQLDTLTAACPECEQDNRIPTQKIVVGYRFSCSDCGRKYEIVEQLWRFEDLINDVNSIGTEG